MDTKRQRAPADLDDIESRLVRIETRICVLMLALGIDPNATSDEVRKRYNTGQLERPPLWRVFKRS